MWITYIRLLCTVYRYDIIMCTLLITGIITSAVTGSCSVCQNTPSVMSTRCTSMQNTNTCLRGLSSSGFPRIFGMVTRQALRSHSLSDDISSFGTPSSTSSWEMHNKTRIHIRTTEADMTIKVKKCLLISYIYAPEKLIYVRYKLHSDIKYQTCQCWRSQLRCWNINKRLVFGYKK